MNKKYLKYGLNIAFVILLVIAIKNDVSAYVFSKDWKLWDVSGWMSVSEEKVYSVKFLLWLGADPKYRNTSENGRNLTTIENAVVWGNVEIVKILLPLISTEQKSEALRKACARLSGLDVEYNLRLKKVISVLESEGVVPGKPQIIDRITAPTPGICFKD